MLMSLVVIWHANEALRTEPSVGFVHLNIFSTNPAVHRRALWTFVIVPHDNSFSFLFSFFQAQKAEAAADAKWKAKQLFNASVYLVTVQFEITIFYQVLY